MIFEAYHILSTAGLLYTIELLIICHLSGFQIPMNCHLAKSTTNHLYQSWVQIGMGMASHMVGRFQNLK